MDHIPWAAVLLKTLILVPVWYLGYFQLKILMFFLFARRVTIRSVKNELPVDPGFARFGFRELGGREERLGPWKTTFLVLHHDDGIYCDVPDRGGPYLLSVGRRMVITRAGGAPSMSVEDEYVSRRVPWPVEPEGQAFEQAAAAMIDEHRRLMDGSEEKEGSLERRMEIARQWYSRWARRELWLGALVAALYLVGAVVFTVVVGGA